MTQEADILARLMTQEADILARLRDDDLAEQIGRQCTDPHHDPRWCRTCEAQVDGIDAYRRAVLGPGPDTCLFCGEPLTTDEDRDRFACDECWAVQGAGVAEVFVEVLETIEDNRRGAAQ